ncbi:homoserine kinase [Xylanimonas allomyrinae]|uniref:Homoserine kinase n=1 Tax=Xylanimonas allomyrinae TaxID=2509459 RepID=A0A4P6EPE0_9MICO|nr:phosphotransferase [Xylanimonas allomyrinae]QAY64632.1 homoserine kinase [Xylanimonas allomyrinae]
MTASCPTVPDDGVVPDVERDVARAALAAFGIAADADLSFVKHRENHVWRVRAPGVDRALRMHRPGYRDDAQLRAECRALEVFRAAGLRVPAPVPTPRGEHVAVVVDAAGTRRQATMQEWCDGGAPVGDVGAAFEHGAGPEPGALYRLGRLAARLHQVASTASVPPSERPAWDAAGLTGPAALWGRPGDLASLDDEQRHILDDAEHAVAERLAGLRRDRATYGLIHADLTFENVLATPDGLVALDFDDSGEGWFMFDLATPAFWCGRGDGAAERVAALVGGYAAVRALTADDAAAWHPLLLARALSYLGWAAQRPDDPVSVWHHEVVAPFVVEGARRFVETGETGWPSLHAAGDAGRDAA